MARPFTNYRSFVGSIFLVIGLCLSFLLAGCLSSGNEPPKVSFSISSDNPRTEDNIIFSANQSRDPDGSDEKLKFQWDLDDDTTNRDSYFTHAYEAAGLKYIVLTVTDEDGETTIKETTLLVRNQNWSEHHEGQASGRGGVSSATSYEFRTEFGDREIRNWLNITQTSPEDASARFVLRNSTGTELFNESCSEGEYYIEVSEALEDDDGRWRWDITGTAGTMDYSFDVEIDYI